MSQFFVIHPRNPQPRLVRHAVEILHAGGIIVYPTDSCYALGCRIGDKAALEGIRRIRAAGRNHNFTLVCRDLSEIATYAKVENWIFRMLKAMTPGPFTFILPATHEVPRRLQHPRRKTIGIRIPEHPVAQAILSELGAPILSSTLLLPDEEQPMTDPEVIRERLEHQVELVIDGGSCGLEPTTIVDLTSRQPAVLRQGRGDASMYLAG